MPPGLPAVVFPLLHPPTLGWAGLTLPPPSLRAAENSFSKKTNGSQCLVRRFPPPSSRQTGSLVRAGGGLPGCRILCLRGASAGVRWSRSEYTAADRGLLEGEHFKRNLRAATEVGVGVPIPGLKSLSVTHSTQASHVPHLILQVGSLPRPPLSQETTLPIQDRASYPLSLAGFGVRVTFYRHVQPTLRLGCLSERRGSCEILVARGLPHCLGRVHSCVATRRQRKTIKLVLKEGHLARETKGLRNPLLWGTFKWGEIPTQASALCRGNMRAATPRRWSPPPLLALFPVFVSYPLNSTWGCLGL